MRWMNRGLDLPKNFPLGDTPVLLFGYNTRLVTIDERIEELQAELHAWQLKRDAQVREVTKLIERYHDEGRAQ